MADSGSQHRVGRVRPPRVQITYDVEDGDATESRELPMVVGVVSDLSGDGSDPVEYRERSLVEVGQGGVDRFMSRVAPQLSMDVEDKLSDDEGAEMKVELAFNSLDDFSPMGVAAQVPATAKLLELRRQLADLYGKVEANDKLDGILGDVLADADKRDQLASEIQELEEGDEGDEGDEGEGQ